jgi:hypothetical protein
MAIRILEMEGTWEEILEHSPELTGRRVRVRVLPENGSASPNTEALRKRSEEMLAAYEDWKNTPWTEEERAILDDFEQFRKEHPFRLRQIEDES